MLEVRQLVKRFGALAATDGASFTVLPGELHALIGPNGAGKTTLIHQISGALRPDAGQVLFEGRDVTPLGIARRVQAGLVRSFQISSLFGPCSVRDNLRLAVLARREAPPSWWRPARADVAARAEADALLARVGLASLADRVAGELAHGEQRQLEVGLALAARPRLLLLVEHDMDAVFRLADRVTTLVAGRVIASGEPAAIRAHAEVRRAYLGDELEAAR